VTSVHQVLAAAAPADAVTGQALAWRERFRSWGLDSEVLAEHVHHELESEVGRLDRYRPLLLDARVVILHYSVWSAAVEAVLTASGKRVLWYHNITPGSLLREFNPDLAALCDRGRDALPRLRGRFDLYVAVSAFNAHDLRQAGIRDVVVVPLLLDVPPAPPPLHELPAPPLVITVGRVVPNKRIEDVIKVFALYRRYHAPEARLAIVGSSNGFDEYRERLDALGRSLARGAVQFTGRISAEARNLRYDTASAYLCMSVHEGFCAPLIEALAHGTPVVARDAGAVAETLGGAGVVVDGSDLAVFAEAVHEVVSSERTRAMLEVAAARRLGSLAPAAIEARVRDELAPLLA
jgi:glycosyltransferase involved in cell wall biosynthesis